MVSEKKQCPYCKKMFNVSCEPVVEDGNDMDNLNSEIIIERLR